MGFADIGVVGLAVMGRNLALNIAEKGFTVAVYNRSKEKTDETVAEAGPLAERLIPCATLADLRAALKPPRSVLLMVKAGEAFDATLAQLLPHLDPGDCVIDAGNANYRDTIAHQAKMSAAGFVFLGIGVSGGEEGARHGPSIMAGGEAAAYARVAPILTAIAARYQGIACAAHVGPGGAGHFVKTVHNGIEYADMQMIAEAYGMMRYGLGIEPDELAGIFDRWNSGPLGSYLIEITAAILKTRDAATGLPIVDVIVDSAGQKGTGRWAAIEALELAVPVPGIAAAVDGRVLSASRKLRGLIADRFGGESGGLGFTDKRAAVDLIEQTLLAGKICAYAQGFDLMAAASAANTWSLPLAEIARIWRAGCIIRSGFLDTIAAAYDANPDLPSLLLDHKLGGLFQGAEPSARTVLSAAIQHRSPALALTSAIAWFDSLRQSRTTADLIQGQRDFFGAHGFERTDKPGAHHGPWGGGAGA